MDNSIKVKINYHPVNFMQIALWIMILLQFRVFGSHHIQIRFHCSYWVLLQ